MDSKTNKETATMTTYQLTDFDREYHALYGQYPLRTQALIRKYETGTSEGAAFVDVIKENVYGAGRDPKFYAGVSK